MSGREHAGRQLGLTASTALFFAVLLLTCFVVEQHVTIAAFDRLEATEVSRDAQQIRAGLDSESTLIANYGATNSIWDNSYSDVAKSDEAAFVSDFPPQQLRGLYGIDGILGVGLDGRVRVGGLVRDSNQFEAVPPQLASPALVRSLFDPKAQPGTADCGVATVKTPYLYCGFASYHGNNSGPVVGGLIYLKSLGATGLMAIGRQIGVSLKQIPALPTGANAGTTLRSPLGSMKVSTLVLGANRIAVDVVVPARAAQGRCSRA